MELKESEESSDGEMDDVDEDTEKTAPMLAPSPMQQTRRMVTQTNTMHHRRVDSWMSMPLTRVVHLAKVHPHQIELTNMVGQQNSPRSSRSAVNVESMTE